MPLPQSGKKLLSSSFSPGAKSTGSRKSGGAPASSKKSAARVGGSGGGRRRKRSAKRSLAAGLSDGGGGGSGGQAVSELALMFRDLEVAVSGLELLHDLRRRGGGRDGDGVIGGGMGGAERKVASVPDGGSVGGPPITGNVAAVAEQLMKWRDLCDEALLGEA